MKTFHIIVLIIFGVLAVIAVFVFATFSSRSSDAVGSVEVWGTLPIETMQNVLSAVKNQNKGYGQVRYREMPEGQFSATLTEAIAAGEGPDLVLLPAASVVNESDKLIPISYRTVSRRAFQDAFIEAGELFLNDSGVLGLPFSIDPYVLYWNRTLFSGSGISRPPRYWDEFVDIAPKISKVTASGTLTQSAVALGEWQNINHAKDILVSLIVGLGNPVVSVDGDGKYVATLNRQSDTGTSPAESALRFYGEFSDPVKSVYSWNRSQAPSQSAFLAGTLGAYFGQASEVFTLRAANPNLNFDVAPYPRVRGGVEAVPASVYALSIPRGSTNTRGALLTALLLSGAETQKILVAETGLPSVRRDVQSVSPENPYESIFRDASLNAYGFRDPNPAATDAIFRRMVEGVSSGELRISEAIQSGQRELDALLKVQ